MEGLMNKSKKSLVFSLALSTASLAAMASEVEVAPSYSPLSLTANSISLNSDFSSTAVLDNIVADQGSSSSDTSNSSICSDPSYTYEQCLAGYSVDLDASGYLEITNRQRTSVVTYGEVPHYHSSLNNGEDALVRALGFIPGALVTGYLDADGNSQGSGGVPAMQQEVTLGSVSPSFTVSVEFQVDDAGATDYFQVITLGSSRVLLRKDQSAGDEITFVSPVEGVAADVYAQQAHDPGIVGGTIPEGTWLEYSVSYDASTADLTHTITNLSTSSVLATYTQTGASPYVKSQPMVVMGSIWAGSSSAPVSTLRLDNYNNTQPSVTYHMDLSPLTYNSVDYDADGYGVTVVLSDLIVNSDNSLGGPFASDMVETDNTKLGPYITGIEGNDLNVALLTFSGGYKYTYITAASEADFTSWINSQSGGATIDVFYRRVYIANGEGQDYLINTGLSDEDKAVLFLTDIYGADDCILCFDARDYSDIVSCENNDNFTGCLSATNGRRGGFRGSSADFYGQDLYYQALDYGYESINSMYDATSYLPAGDPDATTPELVERVKAYAASLEQTHWDGYSRAVCNAQDSGYAEQGPEYEAHPELCMKFE